MTRIFFAEESMIDGDHILLNRSNATYIDRI